MFTTWSALLANNVVIGEGGVKTLDRSNYSHREDFTCYLCFVYFQLSKKS